jgi:hypothetical protein
MSYLYTELRTVYSEIRADTFTTLSKGVSAAACFTPLMSQSLTAGCI